MFFFLCYHGKVSKMTLYIYLNQYHNASNNAYICSPSKECTVSNWRVQHKIYIGMQLALLWIRTFAIRKSRRSIYRHGKQTFYLKLHTADRKASQRFPANESAKTSAESRVPCKERLCYSNYLLQITFCNICNRIFLLPTMRHCLNC